MLYLLRSYLKGGDSMLKVGYAGDYEYRLSQYTSHNPGIEEVSKIDGELIEETILHLYLHLKNFGIYKDEWYKDCQEVIDIFNSYSETTEKAVWENRTAAFGELSPKCPSQLKSYEYLLLKFGVGTEEEIDRSYFSSKIRREEAAMIERLNKEGSALSEIDTILKSILSIRFFHARLKYIYSLNMPENIAKKVLESLSDPDYSKYYWVIPASRASALKFQRGSLEVEYRKLTDRDTLAEIEKEVESAFVVGKSYTKTEIKHALKEIYSSKNFQQSAKASDLKLYLNIVECRVPVVGEAKGQAGFKILSRRGAKDVTTVIYETFKEGDRYTKSELKGMLSDIYCLCGMTKTPKANDLEEYFELRRAVISVDGKRSEGFEILKKKD